MTTLNLRSAAWLLAMVTALVAAGCDGNPATYCDGDEPPKACGKAGSACRQTCDTVKGKWGACEPPSGPIDVQKDPKNCGICGEVCPVPVHAAPICTAGACGRGPCEAGYFDLDGKTTFGCEAQCTGGKCTDGSGATITLTSPPLAESGTVFQSLASGSSFGGAVQTTATHTNIGILGEMTPPPVQGAATQKNATHVNEPGLPAALH